MHYSLIAAALLLCYSSGRFTGLAQADACESMREWHIKADSVKWDQSTAQTIYRGNVVLTHGNLLIRGEFAELENHSRGGSQVIFSGQPASFTDTVGLERIAAGQASKISYNPGRMQLELNGNPRLEDYNSDTQVSYNCQNQDILIRGLNSTTSLDAVMVLKKKKWQITARNHQVNSNGTLRAYQGDVVIVIGDVVLAGDSALIDERSGHGSRISLRGHPANFKQVQGNLELGHGSAESIVYLAEFARLDLNGKPLISNWGAENDPNRSVSYNAMTHDIYLAGR